MKLIVFFFCFMFWTYSLQAEVTLRGIITYQNTGAKMYALQVSARGASPTITRAQTNKEGAFILTFPQGKVGDIVFLEISTPIYDLVNDKRDLEIVLSENTSFRIHLVVCKKGERDANAVQYYNISTKYLETRYNKLIKKKDNQIAQLQKRIIQNTANNEELLRQIYALQLEKDKLNDQFEEQKKSVLKLAEDFSRIDLAQADDIYGKAFKAFKQGDIDNARQILNSKIVKQQEIELKKLSEEIQEREVQILKANDLLRIAQQKLEEAKIQRDSLKESVIRKKILDGQLAELQFKFKEAEVLYIDAIKLDENNVDNLWKLASLYFIENETQNSILYYEKALALSKSEYLLGTFTNNLGNSYMLLNKVLEAEKYLCQSLEIRERLSLSNPDLYEVDLGGTTMNLGVLYRSIRRMPEAEEMLLRSLEIRERLAEKDSIRFKPDLASTLMNLGNFYYFNNERGKAEIMYLHAFEIYNRFAQKYPDKYEFELSTVAMNLGNFYYFNNEMSKSEEFHLQSLTIRKKLAEKSPAKFDPDLAMTYSNLANLYSAIGKVEESEKMYLHSLEIRERLAIVDSSQYEPSLAATLVNLAALYSDIGKLTDSEKNYLCAINIYERLIINNLLKFKRDAATAYGNFANLKLIMLDYEESEKSARRGIELDDSEIWIKIYIAHALLFQNEDVESKKIYDDLKTQDDDDGTPFYKVLLREFEDLEKLGLDTVQIDKARKWLED